MSVVVADLVAKVRADTSEAQAGLQGVGREARATAEQLDALARRAASMSRFVDVDKFREALERSGITAAQAAASLGQVGNQSTQAAAGAERLASAMRATAQAAQDIGRINVSPGFAAMLDSRTRDQERSLEQSRREQQALYDRLMAARNGGAGGGGGGLLDALGLNEGGLIRATAALAGIGLGLNLAAGAAAKLHDAVAGIVQSQLTWERSLKETRGIFGDQAQSAVAMAQALSTAPGMAGSQQVFLSAAMSSAYLSNRFGMSGDLRAQLLGTAGRVAAARGLTSDEEAAQQQKAFLEAVESGGTSLRDINVEMDPEVVARALGFQSGQALGGLTPQQLRAARAAVAIQGGNAFVRNAVQEGRGALDAQAAGARQLQQARDALQNMLENVGQGQLPAEAYTGGGEGAIFGMGLQYLTASDEQKKRIEEQRAAVQQLQEEQTKLNAAAEEWRQKLGNIDKAQAEATSTLQDLQGAATTTTMRLLDFTGSLENRTSIAWGDITAQAQAAVAARARSANPARAMSSAEISALSLNAGYQAAWQNYVAPTGQAELQQAQGIRAELEARGASGAIADAERRVRGALVGGYAARAGDLASRAQTEAEAQLSALSLRSDERHLAIAEDLARYRSDMLTTEGQMTGLLLRQADLQDRIRVASRDDLQTRRELISAQQAALGPQGALNDLQYADQRVQLLAQVRQSRLYRGMDVSDLPTLSDLIQQHLGYQIAQPEVALQALDTGHAVDVIQRQRTGQDLARQQTLTGLEGQQRSLEDQLQPLQEHLRLVQARADAEQRAVDLLDLQDTTERTVAERQMNDAAGLKLVVEEIARQADDYANGLNMGASALERAQSYAEATRDALKQTTDLVPSISEPSIDQLLSRTGGWAADANRSRSVVINFNGPLNVRSDQDVKDIAQQAADLVMRGMDAASDSGPRAAPELPGARR